MNRFIYLFIFITAQVFAQPKELSPTLGELIDKNAEGEKKALLEEAKFQKIAVLVNTKGIESLTPADKKFYENYPEVAPGYWDVLGGGCSWYCGGGTDTRKATSELPASKTTTYSAKNIHDLNYKTAWVEGVKGYGVGESVTYTFPATSPRITKIIVVNGYVKSKEAWTQNSRVKKLRMYIDGKLVAILNLADSRQEQIFTFDPIGVSDRKDIEKMQKMPDWKIKFEIADVYKGSKYDDTAITEIYFDGIDVH